LRYELYVMLCFQLWILLCVWTVHVFLKDYIFEASCPTRHKAELGRQMKELYLTVVAIIMYTDGGTDYNCKHMSIRLGLFPLFLETDLDNMVVVRTAPAQRWGNPMGLFMPVLNFGLQSVALAREEMSEIYEKVFKKCNNMNDLRKAAMAYEMNDVELAPDPEELEQPREQQQQSQP